MKFFAGGSLSLKTLQAFGGIGFQPGEVFGFEIYANALYRQLEVNKLTFNDLGNAAVDSEAKTFFRPSVGLNLNFRISW